MTLPLLPHKQPSTYNTKLLPWRITDTGQQCNRYGRWKICPGPSYLCPEAAPFCEYNEDVGGVILGEEQPEEFGKRVGQA